MDLVFKSSPFEPSNIASSFTATNLGINNNIPQKFGWMTNITNAIIPSDPMIASQVRPIFSEVCILLNHQQYFPTIIGVELSSIRLLMHVICSKIT
jgi:hypothetical protein